MGLDNNYFDPDHSQHSGRAFSGAGRGALRVALLFGSAALALALIIVPILNDQANQQSAQSLFPGVDMTKTGSINRDGGNRDAGNKNAGSSYTIRKSVLQASPLSACVIAANGQQSGDC